MLNIYVKNHIHGETMYQSYYDSSFVFQLKVGSVSDTNLSLWFILVSSGLKSSTLLRYADDTMPRIPSGQKCRQGMPSVQKAGVFEAETLILE